MKLPDKIKIDNFFFISKVSTTNYLPSLIAGLYFPPVLITITTKGRLKIPADTTTTLLVCKGAFISMATKTWNKI